MEKMNSSQKAARGRYKVGRENGPFLPWEFLYEY
jgi:hypothetical protein